jgi:hypothetical protein
MPIPKLPGSYIPPWDEWGPPPTVGDTPDSPVDSAMVVPAPEPDIDPNMRQIDPRRVYGFEDMQRPENNVDTLRPLVHNIADVQVSEAQPPADFNTLFNTPLDEDYRKNLEARDQAEGDDYLSNLVGPSAIQPQQSSWWYTAKSIGSGALAVGKDLSGAFTEAGHWAIGGPLRGAEAIIDSARDTATWMNENVGEIPFAIQLYDKDGTFKPKALFGDEAKGIKEIDINLPNPGGVRDVPETVTASILQGLTQFATGYGVAGRATGIGNSFGGALTKGFIADYASQQGNEPNFANLLQAAEQVFPGVMKPVNEYLHVDALAAKPGDANAEGRLRNALVGVVPNVLIPVVVAGARRIRAARAATELADNAVAPKIGQVDDAIDNAVRPVPATPAEAVIGTVDEPLIARVEQKIGPNDLGVPDQFAARGLLENSKVPAAEALPDRPPPLPQGMDQVQGIRLFHGSPHDFDQFDASKIGTGEGAQAYGHGLYFAESEGVARSYRDQLSGKTWGGKPLDPTDPRVTAGMALDITNGDVAAARTELIRGAEQYESIGLKHEADNARAALNHLEDGTALREQSAGRMYEVHLNAQPEQFLDWDKPLSQQSEAVRAKLAKHAARRLAETAKAAGLEPRPISTENILSMPGREFAPRTDADVAALKDAGIVGIRYLDGNSRAKGEGSANYVVFPGNEDKIKITAKDGKPFTTAETDDILAQIKQAQEASALPSHSVEAGGYFDDHSSYDTAAVEYNGKVFIGATHLEAMGTLQREMKLSDEAVDALLDANAIDDGFYFHGKYLTRQDTAAAGGDPEGYVGAEELFGRTAEQVEPFGKRVDAKNVFYDDRSRAPPDSAPGAAPAAGGGGQGAPPGQPPSGTPTAPANGPQPGPFSSEFKFNWSKIETDADMKAMAGQVMDAYAPELKARGKGVVQTWQETAQKANALSAIEMLVEEGAVKGKALDAVQLEAAGNIYVSALKDLKRVTQIATSPNAGPEDLMAWDHMLRVFRMAQNLYVPAQAEAGRALNILRKTKGESALYTQELRRMVSQMGGEDVLRAKAAAISDLLQRGPDKLPPSVIQKSVTAKSLDTVIELWKAGLLSGPKTHIVNFASNAQVLGLVVGERKIAGMIGEVLDPISGVKAQEAGYLAWGMKQHLRDAFRAMAKTFKTNQQQWGGAQAELPYVQRMSSEHWGVNPESFMGKGLDMLGSVTNLPFRALGASDAFFKELHYGAELKASALRAASEEVARGKIPADQFPLRLQELLDNPTDAIRAGARDFASVNTFTSEPGRILTAINQLRNADHAGLRFLGNFVMPFTNTPGKILNFFTDRSPIGLVSNQMRADLAAGGAKRDIALAKMGVGTIALGVGYDLAMDGWVTGPGPAKNDNKRQAMMRGGWRPWSIKVPDGVGKDGMPTFVYVPISRFDPGAMPLLMGAALAEITRYQGGKVNREWDEIWAASTMSLADVMMQKTTMIGFANLVQAMSEPSQFADRYMKSAARSFVPAGVAWIEEIKDPVLRQTWSLWAAAKERTPYLSETLPPRLDIWGRELSAEGMLGQPWEALIPSRMSSTGKALPVDRELLRLNRALRYPSYIPIKGRNIPLDNLPEAQNRLVTLMNARASALLSDENLNDLADNRKQHVIRALEAFEDRSLVEALSEMIKGEGPFGDKYLEADDEEKGQLISDVKSKYEQAARVQVLREFPKIREIRDNLPERSDLGIEAPF